MNIKPEQAQNEAQTPAKPANLENANNRYGGHVEALMQATHNPGDLPLLGAVCWFDLQSGASRAGLENALLSMTDQRARAIITEYTPPVPKPDQSFNYAIANAATGFKDVRVERVKKNDAMTLAGVLHRQERKGANGGVDGVDYVQSSRVALLLTDRAGVELPTPKIVHEKEGCEIGERLENLYDWHRDHLTPDDIRPMVTQTFEAADRLILRRSGGMYFVPVDHLDTIRQLFDLLETLRCSGYFLPIFETTEALETLGQCAQDNTLDDVTALMNELARFDEQLEDGKIMRAATLEARQDKLDDLRSKTKLYSRILQHDVQAIESAFQQAEDKLVALATKRDKAIDTK